MKKILIAFVLMLSLSLFASTILADSTDDEVRSIVLDLKIKGFSQSNWYDNLDSSNLIFAPGDKFQLQLKIKNEGNRNQTQIVVRQTLPSTVTTNSDAIFTIPQIAAGQDYTKDITVTVRDQSYILKALTNNSIRFTAKTEVGTEGSDYASFFTSNGTKQTTTDQTPVLPVTGPVSNILFGSAIAIALAFSGLKLRRVVRGY